MSTFAGSLGVSDALYAEWIDQAHEQAERALDAWIASIARNPREYLATAAKADLALLRLRCQVLEQAKILASAATSQVAAIRAEIVPFYRRYVQVASVLFDAPGSTAIEGARNRYEAAGACPGPASLPTPAFWYREGAQLQTPAIAYAALWAADSDRVLAAAASTTKKVRALASPAPASAPPAAPRKAAPSSAPVASVSKPAPDMLPADTGFGISLILLGVALAGGALVLGGR